VYVNSDCEKMHGDYRIKVNVIICEIFQIIHDIYYNEIVTWIVSYVASKLRICTEHLMMVDINRNI
jgi:hypothetical protein